MSPLMLGFSFYGVPMMEITLDSMLALTQTVE